MIQIHRLGVRLIGEAEMKCVSSLAVLLAGLAGLIGFGGSVRAADPLQVDPGHHKLEFENAYFRVDRGFFGPGEIAADFFDAEGVVIVIPRGSNAASQRVGDDALASDPQHWKVEVENDAVRTLRYRGDPHVKGALHGHSAHVVVFLTNAKTLLPQPDGKSFVSVRKAGEVISVAAGEHAPENLLDEPVEVILIERK